jgi:K+-sensing histidine kinase KdpD
MSAPKKANAYVDPGSGAMLWQIAAAAIIGTLFYVRRVMVWIRNHLGLHARRSMGFLFASCYALVASPIICNIFHSRPLPRFNDIFLVGIVLATYLFTWDAAAYLLVISTLVSVYVLPPYGTLAIARMEDWYRIVSFVALSVFLIILVTRLKTRTTEPAQPPLHAHSMAIGD